MTNALPQSEMRGILLAGGSGSRLGPLTSIQSKHLLPLYDKPLIYYPLCLQLELGLEEVLLICAPQHLALYQALLGDGRQWGLAIRYAVQPQPRGIAEALLIAVTEGLDCPLCLALGDNVFLGEAVTASLPQLRDDALQGGAALWAYAVPDARDFGVVELSPQGQVLSLEEKPSQPRSNLAVPGFYCYDGQAGRLAAGLSPSARGELEITALHQAYARQQQLRAVVLADSVRWFDCGTEEGLFLAAQAVREQQQATGRLVACPEETAWRQGRIGRAQLAELAQAQRHSAYGRYLNNLLESEA